MKSGAHLSFGDKVVCVHKKKKECLSKERVCACVYNWFVVV